MSFAVQPGAQFGPYRVVGELGRGAMGAVLRVRDAADRELALKILTGNTNATQLQRFLREAEVTASLRHPGIVAVHDAGFVGELAYLVMDLVEGKDLEQEFASLPRERLLDVVLQVSRALGHAHRHGVIHRDIKPSNVLVTPAGEAKLADFGLAQAAGLERLTRSGAALGTPNAMAPEQVLGDRKAYGPPTDVWALGVMLYRVLTQRDPFEGDGWVQLMAQINSVDPEPPQTYASDVSPALQQVCLKALAKAPADRYPHADAFAEDLQRALQGQSVEASAAPRFSVSLPLPAALALLAVAGALAATGWLVASRSSSSPEAPRASSARPPAAKAAEAELLAELAPAGELLASGALADADLRLRRLLAKAPPEVLRPALHELVSRTTRPEQLAALTVLLRLCALPGYGLDAASPVPDAALAATAVRIKTDLGLGMDVIQALADAGARPSFSRAETYALLAVAYNTLSIGMVEPSDYNRLLHAAVRLDLPILDRQLESAESFAVGRNPDAVERYLELRVFASRRPSRAWDTSQLEALLREGELGPRCTADGLATAARFATDERAVALLREALALDPDTPYARRALALRLSALGLHREAQDAIEAAIEGYVSGGFDKGPETVADIVGFRSAEVVVLANAGEQALARRIYEQTLCVGEKRLDGSLRVRFPWLEDPR
ncbi:MAG: serine/threonine protein kinase [Planctomycetes bacterium]|nr:serine/threonine protein kinase [Planctomycetota bacterium]